ncbi:uncharacterized protein LOC113211978 isoform X1 [Frankliniella occidentalis]|uniref:Uncharacterized protein LOC113211978 isoform X1 n=1 Tax=Frankliniella occidentalis TaxID=133901 RepID=A0A6J1T6Q5_FRAOC|nr:uncharacterized protein LOC113211978 isoform X1 [Frankliniella occidentalis]
MSNPSRDVWLVSWMLLACLIGDLTSLQPSIGCNATMEDCLKCRSADTGGSLCVKCANLIVMESRLCVDSCPLGYREEWSSQIDYMGRVCAEGSLLLGALALSGSRLSVVVGVLCGAAICILLLVAAGILLRFRRSRSTRHWKQEEQHLSAGSAQSTISRHSHGDAAERGEFLKHIWTLRSEAPIFLAMLNDTRRQVRTLLQAHTSKHSAVQAYRPVLKDLSRILILLNRRDDCITYPPDDWRTLLGWGERVLRRYKKHNPQEVDQLVNFLKIQTNPTYSTHLGNAPKSNSLSSFQAASNPSSPQPVGPIGPISGDWSDSCADDSLWDCTAMNEWPSAREFLDEDDFLTLGFRPQDEITTEL